MKLKIEIKALDSIARGVWGIQRELCALNQKVGQLVDVLTPPTAARILFFVEEGGKLKRIGATMNQKVTEPKKFVLKIQDKFGNDAKVDGLPAWDVTDASLADIVVADDGLSAVVTPKGPVGSFSVHAHADADLGEGVKDIAGEVAIDLLPGDAEVIVIAEAPIAP